MRRGLALAAAVTCLLASSTAFAHRIDEYLQATLLSLQDHRLRASMRLIPGIQTAPGVIAAIDRNHDGVFSEDEKRAYAEHVLADLSLTVDGHTIDPQLVSWTVPQPAQLRDGLGEIHIEYAAGLPRNGIEHRLVLVNRHLAPTSVYLVNAEVPDDHTLQITGQQRNPSQTVYELDYTQTGALAGIQPGAPSGPRLGVWLSRFAFSSLFHLGMRHIAEGTDHLLFLLTLLLPAPLLACGRRWGGPADLRRSLVRVLGIVTAFTAGHSITLTLAAMGAVQVPARPVEILIAVSILVSALHALRPLLAGREAFVAAFFGLIHGLAFASTLDRLGLGRWDRAGGILSFNLGIEAMQMIVVAALLPSLLLLSRTRAYPVFRVGGAVFAGVAAAGWIVQRSLNLQVPVDLAVNALARHAAGMAAALFVLSLACRLLLGSETRAEAVPGPYPADPASAQG